MPDQGISVSLRQDQPIPLDVEFTCPEGEILVILGPSGSGKTTLLRTIAGLHSPASGRITCRGRTWLDTAKRINLSMQQRRVGMVFQQYALFPHLSARANVAVALGEKDPAARRRRLDDLFELVHMSGLEDRLPHMLSGGQQQRIAVARALARDPDVLLLDEPFSAVDQQTRRKLVRELMQLHGRIRVPIIHVTHNLNEARRVADRICIIHHGKTLQIDTPGQIMNRPRDAEVAGLIGHYNIFTGTVCGQEAGRRRTCIEWCGYRLESPYRGEFTVGQAVDWVIPAEFLVLHRRDRPSLGEHENPVRGRIEEFIPLGENSSVSIRVEGGDAELYMVVPTHVARRNNLDQGGEVTVTLLCEGIHLMQPAQLAQTPARTGAQR